MAGKLGDRIHHVQIQQNNATGRNQDGSPLEDWGPPGGGNTPIYRYAEIEPLTGREYFNAQQVGANVDYKFTMRYYPLTPDMRIVWGNRIFNLVPSMNPGEQANGTDMIVMAKEHRPTQTQN